MSLTEGPSGDRPVALVTGGGSGIGAATAQALAEAGWDVVICGRRIEALRSVAERTGAHPIQADVNDVEVVRGLVEATAGRSGRLDGLVLNAGVTGAGRIGDLSEDVWAAVVDTNLTAPYRLLNQALPHLIRSRGAVVAVSSVSGLRASTGTPAYNTTKAGLSMLTQSVAMDYGPEGVRANVVCPGWTRTEMADEEMAELGEQLGTSVEGAYEIATSLVPQRRPASAAEVAAAIIWLLSPAASYVNGAVLPVDGGLAAVDAGTIAFAEPVGIPPTDHVSRR